MNRLLLAVITAALLALGGAGSLTAQETAAPPAGTTTATDTGAVAATNNDAAWPTHSLAPHNHARGPGWYVSLWKVGLIFFTFLIWCRTTDWVSRDVGPVGLPYDVWNPIVFAPFFIVFFLFMLLIPWFWLGFPLLLIAQFAPLAVYILKRNKLVPDADKVLTKDHIRYLIANAGKGFGAKIDAEKKLAHEKGAPVEIQALGAATEQKNQANLIEARQAPAFLTLKEVLADAIDKRAEKLMCDFTAENVGMKYMIDGVWLDVPPRERLAMDPVAAVMKKLANLNVADRKSKQEGVFSAEYKSTKYMCALSAQGTATGERILLSMAGKAHRFASLDELGMRDKMRDQVKQLLAYRHGIIVFTSMPSGGLSSTMQMALKSTDRLLRDFAAVGEKTRHEPEVENVENTPFDSSKGETAMTVLPKLILRQPDVLVIRELTDGDTLKTMIAQCTDDNPKLSITTLRAKDAVEGVARLLALKVPAAEVAPVLLFVLNTRLIRKLCDKCKEPYEPAPELLARLGIPAGRVQQLYRERQPLPPDSKEKRPPCPQCSDIGYFGRTAIFELLVINDKFREAMIKDPKLETLKKVAKATGHRGLQEEGIVLIALGTTSLTELQRVLKQ